MADSEAVPEPRRGSSSRRSPAASPEFRLAATCCRWPPAPARDSAVRHAAASVADWPAFLDVLRRQRVAGLAHEALSAAGVAPPSPVAGRLAAQAELIVRRNLLLGAETVRLHRLFESAQLPVLILKGAALAQIAYGSLGTKHARDIDLLVPPECAEAAMRLLERDGYALVSPARRLDAAQLRALVQYGREVELSHRSTGAQVELQWRIADNPLLLRSVSALSPTQQVRLSGADAVRTLTDPDLFAALCVHGALHAWSRMKWLADLNAFVAARGADLVPLYRHAQAIGAGLCAAQALLLCHDLFGLELPSAFSQEIARDGRVAKLAAIGLAAMTAPQPVTDPARGTVSMARLAHAHFLLGRGPAFFAAQCRVMAVGPADVIRRPLPRSLHFLYPLLRLPLWLWRRGRAALERRLPRAPHAP